MNSLSENIKDKYLESLHVYSQIQCLISDIAIQMANANINDSIELNKLRIICKSYFELPHILMSKYMAYIDKLCSKELYQNKVYYGWITNFQNELTPNDMVIIKISVKNNTVLSKSIILNNGDDVSLTEYIFQMFNKIETMQFKFMTLIDILSNVMKEEKSFVGKYNCLTIRNSEVYKSYFEITDANYVDGNIYYRMNYELIIQKQNLDDHNIVFIPLGYYSVDHLLITQVNLQNNNHILKLLKFLTKFMSSGIEKYYMRYPNDIIANEIFNKMITQLKPDDTYIKFEIDDFVKYGHILVPYCDYLIDDKFITIDNFLSYFDYLQDNILSTILNLISKCKNKFKIINACCDKYDNNAYQSDNNLHFGTIWNLVTNDTNKEDYAIIKKFNNKCILNPKYFNFSAITNSSIINEKLNLIEDIVEAVIKNNIYDVHVPKKMMVVLKISTKEYLREYALNVFRTNGKKKKKVVN